MSNEYFQDLEICSRDGRDLSGTTRFRIRIDDEFHQIEKSEFKAQDLLSLAGKDPENFSLFVKFRGGGLEELKFDAIIDFTVPKTERFLTFPCTKPYSFEVDGLIHKWRANFITGLRIKQIAQVDPEKYELWRENPGAEDQQISDDQFVNLSEEGDEKFFTALANTTAGENIQQIGELSKRNFCILKILKCYKVQNVN